MATTSSLPPVATTTTTTAVATPFDHGWQRVAVEPPAYGSFATVTLTVAATGRPGIVAFGSNGTSAITNETGGYFSPDGHRWTEIPDDRTIFGYPPPAPGTGGGSQVTSVVAWGSGFVAVGYVMFGTSAVTPSSDVSAAVWRTADGLHWSRVNPADAALANASMTAVAAVPGGLIAIGSDSPGSNPSVLLWRSVDGQHWQRLQTDPAFAGANIAALVADGPRLLAAGSTVAADHSSVAGVWLSDNGIHWTRTLTRPYAFISGVIVGATVVAFGSASGPDQLAERHVTWTPDPSAREWKEFTDTGFPDPPQAQISMIGMAAGHYFAADIYARTLYTSTDGIVWQQVHDDRGALPTAADLPASIGVAVSVGSQVALLGGVHLDPPATHEPMQPVAWLWTP